MVEATSAITSTRNAIEPKIQYFVFVFFFSIHSIIPANAEFDREIHGDFPVLSKGGTREGKRDNAREFVQIII